MITRDKLQDTFQPEVVYQRRLRVVGQFTLLDDRLLCGFDLVDACLDERMPPESWEEAGSGDQCDECGTVQA